MILRAEQVRFDDGVAHSAVCNVMDSPPASSRRSNTLPQGSFLATAVLLGLFRADRVVMH